MPSEAMRARMPATVASLLLPGAGQFMQRRWVKGAFMFGLAVLMWIGWLGWLVHLWAAVDALVFTPEEPGDGV